MKTEKQWLATKEVAKEFDLNPDTLKKQRYLSKLEDKVIGLPFIQFGPRTIKYNRLDIILDKKENRKKLRKGGIVIARGQGRLSELIKPTKIY